MTEQCELTTESSEQIYVGIFTTVPPWFKILMTVPPWSLEHMHTTMPFCFTQDLAILKQLNVRQ